MQFCAAARLLLIAGMAIAAPVAAQNGAANGGKNGEKAAAPPYQDELIDGGQLEPDIWNGDVPEREATGPPRGVRLDAIYSSVARGGVSESRYGAGVGAFLGTPLYGAWTVDGVFGKKPDSWVATVWQRDMPFEDGWRASNAGGNLNSPSIDLLRYQARWALPSTPLVGGLTEWRNQNGTQLTAGMGEPDVYTGLYVPGFRRLGGSVTTGGLQWAWDRNWSSGVQYAGASEVTSPLQFEPNAERFSSRSVFGATAWQDRNARAQINVLGSGNSFDGNHLGAWGDAALQDGRYGHGFGAFWLGSTLAWANQLVGSDVRGAYYRLNYTSRQWLWDAQVDYTAPVADTGFDTTTFVSGNTRYQLQQDLAVGGGANARFDGTTAWSAYAFVENDLRLLINRTQMYTARNDPKSDFTLTANQTWNVPAGTRLSTSVLVGHFDDGVSASSQFGLAVFGGGDVAPNLSLDANVQWIHSTGDAQPTTLIGNVGFTWRFRPALQLIATLYRSQTQTQQLQIISPITTLTTQLEERVNDRGAYLVLRYEARAGSMAPPLGGMVGGGAGRVTGVVFLDGNGDGRFAAGEQGAANLTVVLDGRYSVRTDGQGRYEFPAVAAGHHTLTIMPDNLPLPWMLINDGHVQFDVPVRGTAYVDVGAQRMR